MSTKPPADPKDDKASTRTTALKHAYDIEEKKKLQGRVLDLILEGYDLPSNPDADPAEPNAKDVALFMECLALFRPTDFDDLVQERNIDDRCGYALCARPKEKLEGAGRKVWNGKSGTGFKFIDKAELERWCSKECNDRATYVRDQLSSEPAWLRNTQNPNVKLLDEGKTVNGLIPSIQALALDSSQNDIQNKLQALSVERGEFHVNDGNHDIAIVEKMPTGKARPPKKTNTDLIEGLPARRVMFDEEEKKRTIDDV